LERLRALTSQTGFQNLILALREVLVISFAALKHI
jgi:hypothetical protein